MGFTKLDDGLAQSSIVTEDDAVFKVWILILSLTESDGIARVSSSFLASVTRKSDDEVERCLAVLESPDRRSRSQVEDGRRVVRIDGGYRVVNHGKYREFSYSQDPEAVRKRAYRAKAGAGRSGTCPGHSASASSSVTEGGVGETSQTTEAVRRVFAHWQAVMGKPKSKLTGDRERRIKSRIREGYTVDDLKGAVDGCKASAWHQGANDDGRIYDDLELICRDGKHVEQFMALPSAPVKQEREPDPGTYIPKHAGPAPEYHR